MHKKALLALVLAVAMFLSGCTLIEKDLEVDRATEVIRVAGVTYTKADVLSRIGNQLNYLAYLYQSYGYSFDPTAPESVTQAIDSVVELLVQDAVMDAKIAELGIDQLTPEEQAELDQIIQDTYEASRESVRSTYFADTELTGDELEAAIDAKCAELGYTIEETTEVERGIYLQTKLMNHVVKDIVVTDEELAAKAAEKAEAEKATYEATPSLFGDAVNNGTPVYYRPAGYRMVKQILIQLEPDTLALIQSLSWKVSGVMTTIVDTKNALYAMDIDSETAEALAAQVTVTLAPLAEDAPKDSEVVVEEVVVNFTEEQTEEVAELVKTLAIANAQKSHYANVLAEVSKAGYEAIDEKTNAVVARIEAGEDWDALMYEITEDPGMQQDSPLSVTGYAICEDYASFDEAFVIGSMGLEKVGDVSAPIKGYYGYYIIKYVADVAEGPVPLEEVREVLTEEMLTERQDTYFTEVVSGWVEEAKPWIDRNTIYN